MRRWNGWAIALVATTLISCGGNPASESPIDCEHVDADGVELSQGNVMLHRQFNGMSEGAVEIPAGETLASIAATFLAEDRVDGKLVSTEIDFAPECAEAFELGVTVTNEAVARVAAIDQELWTFDLEGLQEGDTGLRVAIRHGDHNDYLSLEIPISVTTDTVLPPIEPEALFVRDGPNPIATWNHDEARGADVATGPMLVRLGQTRADLEVVLEGEWDPGDGGVESGSREEIPLPEGPYALRWTVADESVATLADGTDVTRFDLIGAGIGKTTVILELLFQGSPILTSGPIPIVCVDPAAAELADPSFTCVASGLKSVIVDEGTVLPALLPGEGAPCSWWTPGAFELEEGEESTLYSVREFRVETDPCETNTLSKFTYRLSFEFSDPDVARITSHPFHWDEVTVFHVNGLAAGTTTLTMYVTHKDTGALRWMSPPMPVTIEAP